MGRRRGPPPPVKGLIDSHCHLDYEPMAGDLDAALQRAREAGVEQVIQIGCDRERMGPAVELAATHDHVFAAVGVHPHAAKDADEGLYARVRELAAHDKVVAIGETGLDYHYDKSPRDVQQVVFARHIEMAKELDMPLVLHIRDAHDDAWKVVNGTGARANPGVVHCFTGTVEEAERWIEMGWHISFSGIATFKNCEHLREAARRCPDERILLETDAPFLAPEPVRGRRNEPANVAFTCARLAEARGEAPETLARRASRNTRALFGMPSPE